MDRAPSSPSLHRILGNRFVLLAGLAAVVAGCTTVEKHLTGVKLERSRPTTCVSYCNDLYAGLVGQEMKLHDENLGSCGILPEPQGGACMAEEGARHAAEMDRLQHLRAACLRSCVKGAVPG